MGVDMSVAVVSGSAGLIGSEAARHFAGLGLHVVGIDNDMRRYFFGPDGSTAWSLRRLTAELGTAYTHRDVDIRDRDGLARIFATYGRDIGVVIHSAGQPSHDWAAKEPYTDFDVNAVGTLNMLENTRQHAPDAAFIHCSTNKVYGDRPNSLPLVERDTRYEIAPDHPYADGVTETMPIDDCLHSVFGVSKVAADVMVQEYGRYFGLRTACFRCGTLTGPAHSAAELHGFLAYLMRCVMEGRTYNLYGYKGKMVRDAIHSHDVLTAFEAFFREPRSAQIYNLGGGRFANTSHIEAFRLAEEITGHPAKINYVEEHRVGDHQWWISSMARFSGHYPDWKITYDVPAILREIYEANRDTWVPGGSP
jgi:CDP-paratose 2-epimerase